MKKREKNITGLPLSLTKCRGPGFFSASICISMTPSDFERKRKENYKEKNFLAVKLSAFSKVVVAANPGDCPVMRES